MRIATMQNHLLDGTDGKSATSPFASGRAADDAAGAEPSIEPFFVGQFGYLFGS
jgi:hypothetical protein